MKTRNLVVPLAASCFLAAACTVVVITDLSVGWTVEGGTSDAVCEQYGVDTWRVTVTGPDRPAPLTVDCGAWFADFLDIEEGYYDILVEAQDSSGQVLAYVEALDVFVDGDLSLNTVDLDFADTDFVSGPYCGDGTCDSDESCESCSDDCGACASATIDLFWNINGTVDGSDTGASWDACAEVGADQVVFTVDGAEQAFDCAGGGSMSKTIEVEEGNHTLMAVLVDAGGNALTTEIPETTISASASQPGEFIAEFYWESFLGSRSDYTGTFWFNVSYEGGDCSSTTPNVAQQVTLLQFKTKKDPNDTEYEAVADAQVCDQYNGCSDTSGAYPEGYRTCLGPDESQSIADLVWGAYKIMVQGALAGASPDVCWESEDPYTSDAYVDILVGAGTENPEVPLDLARVSTSGGCS